MEDFAILNGTEEKFNKTMGAVENLNSIVNYLDFNIENFSYHYKRWQNSESFTRSIYTISIGNSFLKQVDCNIWHEKNKKELDSAALTLVNLISEKIVTSLQDLLTKIKASFEQLKYIQSLLSFFQTQGEVEVASPINLLYKEAYKISFESCQKARRHLIKRSHIQALSHEFFPESVISSQIKKKFMQSMSELRYINYELTQLFNYYKGTLNPID